MSWQHDPLSVASARFVALLYRDLARPMLDAITRVLLRFQR